MPVLNQIQQTVIAYLKSLPEFKDKLAIIGNSIFSEEDFLATKTTALSPIQLWVSYPFPIQISENLSGPCWEQLTLSCTLIQKNLTKKKEHFLDLAEQISFALSHKNFSDKSWEGSFVLTEKQPWEWLTMKNKTALKVNFLSQNFNILFP